MPGPILLLDDDLILLDVMADLIGVFCKRETVKASSVTALKAHELAALECTAALLDINLGASQASGIDACLWLREKGFKGALFFLTAHAQGHPLVVKARELGVAEVLSKPIDADFLVKLLGGAS